MVFLLFKNVYSMSLIYSICLNIKDLDILYSYSIAEVFNQITKRSRSSSILVYLFLLVDQRASFEDTWRPFTSLRTSHQWFFLAEETGKGFEKLNQSFKIRLVFNSNSNGKCCYSQSSKYNFLSRLQPYIPYFSCWDFFNAQFRTVMDTVLHVCKHLL